MIFRKAPYVAAYVFRLYQEPKPDHKENSRHAENVSGLKLVIKTSLTRVSFTLKVDFIELWFEYLKIKTISGCIELMFLMCFFHAGIGKISGSMEDI